MAAAWDFLSFLSWPGVTTSHAGRGDGCPTVLCAALRERLCRVRDLSGWRGPLALHRVHRGLASATGPGAACESLQSLPHTPAPGKRLGSERPVVGCGHPECWEGGRRNRFWFKCHRLSAFSPNFQIFLNRHFSTCCLPQDHFQRL